MLRLGLDHSIGSWLNRSLLQLLYAATRTYKKTSLRLRCPDVFLLSLACGPLPRVWIATSSPCLPATRTSVVCSVSKGVVVAPLRNTSLGGAGARLPTRPPASHPGRYCSHRYAAKMRCRHGAFPMRALPRRVSPVRCGWRRRPRCAPSCR